MWSFSRSFWLGNLLPPLAGAAGTFTEETPMSLRLTTMHEKGVEWRGIHATSGDRLPLWCCEPEEETDLGDLKAPPSVAA